MREKFNYIYMYNRNQYVKLIRRRRTSVCYYNRKRKRSRTYQYRTKGTRQTEHAVNVSLLVFVVEQS
jgi:hypothetical protein